MVGVIEKVGKFPLLNSEIDDCFKLLNTDQNCRAIILSGSGKSFCAGIDLFIFQKFFEQISVKPSDVARKALQYRSLIEQYQNAFTRIEKCPKPVIATIHGACIGAGLDMICACDIRHCSQDAYFHIKEVELGFAADVGTLQRLPKIIGNHSLMRELAYVGRRFGAEEASRLGFVSRIADNVTELINGALDLAEKIARHSPIAVQGSKLQLNYARDHSVDEALDYMANWNMTMLQSDDVKKAALSVISDSRDPVAFDPV